MMKTIGLSIILCALMSVNCGNGSDPTGQESKLRDEAMKEIQTRRKEAALLLEQFKILSAEKSHDEAGALLNKLINDYPGTKEAKEAQQIRDKAFEQAMKLAKEKMENTDIGTEMKEKLDALNEKYEKRLKKVQQDLKNPYIYYDEKTAGTNKQSNKLMARLAKIKNNPALLLAEGKKEIKKKDEFNAVYILEIITKTFPKSKEAKEAQKLMDQIIAKYSKEDQ
ncbi:MAG: hypothetical protein GY940_08180 [bacterium]|nr:hypothetical protein [bacterium]